jgi:hypothetical protein
LSFTATVSAVTNGATPTGTVDFYDGASTITGCTAVPLSGGTAACVTTALTGGANSIAAAYNHSTDVNYTSTAYNAGVSTAVSQTVNATNATVASFTAADTTYPAANSDTATVGDSVTFTLTLTAPGAGLAAPTGTVEFYNGATPITGCTAKSLISNVATCATTTLSLGANSITAILAADGNYNPPSLTPTLTENVYAVPTTPTITVTSSTPATGSSPVVDAFTTGNTASIPTQTGDTYLWTINAAGTITSAQNGTSVTFTAGDGVTTTPLTLGVTVTNQAGFSASPATANVNVNTTDLVVTTGTDDLSGVAANCPSPVCSLRDALAVASTTPGTITFDPSVTTYTVEATTLTIPASTTITGQQTGSGITLHNATTVTAGGTGYPIFTVSSSPVFINNLTITGANNTNSNGGAITNSGNLILTAVTISNNTTWGSGGGIYNAGGGVLNADGITLTGNTTTPSYGNAGGAIYNDGSLALNDATISGNSANADGGGIFNDAAGTLALDAVTITGNGAPNGFGGGIANTSNLGTTVRLGNVILSGNTASLSSDDYDDYGAVVATITDSTGNIVASADRGTLPGSGIGVTLNTNPINLAPLGSYGGPLQTMLPLPGSAAICGGTYAGNFNGVPADSRGLPNSNTSYNGYSVSSACYDSGAVQTNYSVAFTSAPTTATGTTPTPFNVSVTLTEAGTGSNPVSVFSTAGVSTLTSESYSGNFTAGTPDSWSLGVDSFDGNEYNLGVGSDTLLYTLPLNPNASPIPTVTATSAITVY